MVFLDYFKAVQLKKILTFRRSSGSYILKGIFGLIYGEKNVEVLNSVNEIIPCDVKKQIRRKGASGGNLKKIPGEILEKI